MRRIRLLVTGLQVSLVAMLCLMSSAARAQSRGQDDRAAEPSLPPAAAAGDQSEGRRAESPEDAIQPGTSPETGQAPEAELPPAAPSAEDQRPVEEVENSAQARRTQPAPSPEASGSAAPDASGDPGANDERNIAVQAAPQAEPSNAVPGPADAGQEQAAEQGRAEERRLVQAAPQTRVAKSSKWGLPFVVRLFPRWGGAAKTGAPAGDGGRNAAAESAALSQRQEVERAMALLNSTRRPAETAGPSTPLVQQAASVLNEPDNRVQLSAGESPASASDHASTVRAQPPLMQPDSVTGPEPSKSPFKPELPDAALQVKTPDLVLQTHLGIPAIDKITTNIETPLPKGENKVDRPTDDGKEQMKGLPSIDYRAPRLDYAVGSAWATTAYCWEAPALCHNPLYFEETNLERYGYSYRYARVFQPVVSGAQFFATVPLLPYRLAAEPPCDCEYTLGLYRPGSPAPFQPYYPPLSAKGGLAEAGAAVGLILLIP
jgi:hypothetical protein